MKGFRRVLTVGTALNSEIRKSLVTLVHCAHFKKLERGKKKKKKPNFYASQRGVVHLILRSRTAAGWQR